MLKTICLLLLPVALFAQHPVTFFTKTEAGRVKANLSRYPALQQSYQEIKRSVDAYLGKDIDVPFPKDPAGGYTHDRHKANYTIMFNAGILYNLTGNAQYAGLVRTLFLKYAALNPTLKKHPEATSSSPGHLFWQALNDANWLVYTGMAYDLIYNYLSAADRKLIENGAFKPEVDFITKDLNPWFNLVHNHGVWACAGVGIVGLATNNNEYVEMALKGSDRSGKSGFFAQLNGLFSPDGYYTEGPYYVRYALLPFYLFANSIQHARPALKIFEYRDSILEKALLAGLQQTNINGTFFPLNDAMKEKDYTSNELVTAISIAWQMYAGRDKGLLAVSRKQGHVLLTDGGASIASALAKGTAIPDQYPYTTVEYTDGVKGDEGGISLLRAGKGNDLTTVIYKYTSHGLSHGHFDRLQYSLFDKGHEVLTDYGSVRFVGVEQKWGGRYLPENKSYAEQTVAHSTLVVDETSQYHAKEDSAEKYHGEKLFSDVRGPAVQVVAAKEDHAYKGVHMQRTVYLLQPEPGRRLLADIFTVAADKEHQYDLPFQFNGQLISTSFKYTASPASLQPLGKAAGYQHLWKEAEANLKDTLAQLTFLNGKTYYSISTLVQGEGSVFLTRTGANDPSFNLRREPAMIVRRKGKDLAMVSAVEIHGNFDPVAEFSTNSYPSISSIHLLQNDAQYTVAEIMLGKKKLVIAQCNSDFNNNTSHTAAGLSWKGPYAVQYAGKPIQPTLQQ